MPTPKETATKLIDGTFEMLEGNASYKADVAGEIVDQLIGSDPHSLVRTIAGVPESMVEMISDGMVKVLKEQVKKRLTVAEATEGSA